MNERHRIVQILSQGLGVGTEEIDTLLEIPSDRSRGDLALPCFRLAGVLKRPPADIAKQAAADLSEKAVAGLASVEAVGGYLNIRFDPAVQAKKVLQAILDQGERYGSNEVGAGKTVVLDYSSPNIAKPFSVGHLRSTVIGASVGNLLAFQGYRCVRINHLGDWGTQFGKLIVAYRKWGEEVDLEGPSPIKALLKLYVRFHDEAEADPSLEDQGREWFKRLEDGDPEATSIWERFKSLSLVEFQRMYDRLGVEFDTYSGESFYNDKMQPVIDRLQEKGLLVESRGAKIVDLEPHGLTPIIIQRSDDASLYATRDLAAACYRHETYAFDKNLYFVATQQNEHFKQVFKTLELLGEPWAKDCVHVAFGLISFAEGVMSSRKGKVIFLEDVLDQAVERVDRIIAEKNPELPNRTEVAEQVGVGAIRFYDLSRRRIKDWVFDWARILNFDGDTGPYVMYTHARLSSILRKGVERGMSPLREAASIEFSALDNPEAIEILKDLENFPRAISRAAEEYEPSILAQTLVDIADHANRFYNAHHVLVEQPSVAGTRLLLVACVRTLLRTGLGLLGIAAPEEM
ncbi:MAG: Arginine--tRNA ligase [bacterium]|nr:Arginine--tRNA ligase [bacterium]